MNRMSSRVWVTLVMAVMAIAPATAGAKPQVFGLAPNSKIEKDLARTMGLNALANYFGARRSATVNDMTVKRAYVDDIAQAHTHVQQTFRGVPVFGGEAIAHLNPDGSLRVITDQFIPDIQVANTRPLVSRRGAVLVAKRELGCARCLTGRPIVGLWILRHDNRDYLTWRVQLKRHDGSDKTSQPNYFVDARQGGVVWGYDNLKTGVGNSFYSGTVTIGTVLNGANYEMRDTGRGNTRTYNLNHGTSGTGTLFTDPDDTWGNGTTANLQTAGVDAAYGAQLTWDYFLNVHGRNGIKGDGVGAYSRVHYGNNYVNAFWDDSCFCMTYGDGSGNAHPLTSIDVAGHEMTHGVTSNTADLIYSGESGGLNEATSDIFGTATEFYANNASDVGDYLIGEEIDINGDGTPLRYMDNPSRDGASANCWSSSTGGMDVHYSSGVANHFFYMLSEGSGAKTINGVSYNSPLCGTAPAVPGIGRDKAARIWFRALTVYMTSSTNYAAARTATLNATADLYGGTSSPEWTVVNNTWRAVNVGTGAGPTPTPSSTPVPGTATPTRTPTNTPTRTNTPVPSNTPGGVTVLTNNVPVSGLGGATGSQVYFSLAVPAGATNLSFVMSGGTGDADIYTKFGALPTTSSYDCRPYTSTNNETCNTAAPTPGVYYVMIRGYAAYSGVTLKGSYAGGGGSTPTPVPPTATPVPPTATPVPPTPTQPPSGTELVQNGGFEGTSNPWFGTSLWFWASAGSNPHGGTGYIYSDSRNNISGTTAIAYQQLTIPSSATGAGSFWLNVVSAETTNITQYDKLFVEVRSTSGALLTTLSTYSNLNRGALGAYSQKSFSLAAYRGQTVRLQFRVTTDVSLATTFYIDDVSVK